MVATLSSSRVLAGGRVVVVVVGGGAVVVVVVSTIVDVGAAVVELSGRGCRAAAVVVGASWA
jgi:hypothetical protein